MFRSLRCSHSFRHIRHLLSRSVVRSGPEHARRHHRHRQGLVGRRPPRRVGQGRQRRRPTPASTRSPDPDGSYRAETLRRAPTAWRRRSTGSRPPTRRIVLAAGQTATIDVTLSPARFTQSVVVTARRVEEVAQDVPIPVSVVQRRPRLRRRRLQREPSEGDDPDGAVLFDQSAQLGDQHPRPRRAVRADQRRPRAGRRPLHRRRVLRASRLGDARLPRRRSGRGAARTAGHAVRQEHDRRRHQRHDAQAELHAGHRLRAELRQPAVRAGEGVDHRPARREDRRRGCRSPAPSATARSTTSRRSRT